MRSRARQWIKPSAYIALASLSCLLFSAFTPPLLTPLMASRLPLIGSLPGDLPSYWFRFILSFVLLGLAPAIMALSFREKPSALGLSLAAPILRKPWFWLLLPAAALVGALGAVSPDLGAYYPYSRDMIGRVRESGMMPFVGHFAAYFVLYYIPWEFFFRGFLIFPFALAAERAFGAGGLGNAAGAGAAGESPGATADARAMAIAALVLFQTIPSTMLHFGHPLTELASAVAAGLFFGALAWKTRSIVPGLLLHASIGLGTDLFIVLRNVGRA